MEQPIRHLFKYKHYFDTFFSQQKPSVQHKIDYALQLIIYNERVSEKFFKYIDDGLFEIRAEVGSDIFRIFCCLDAGRLVILMNGFQKKTQKTPKEEIKLAKKLMKEYLENR